MLSLILAAILAAQEGASVKPTPKPSPPPVPASEIQGVVLLPDGKPAAKARVGFLALPALGQSGRTPSVISADELGAFRFETKGVKEFAVRAHLMPFASVAQTRVSGGSRIALKLDAGVTVSGEVLDASTAAPIAGAAIQSSEWELSPFEEADPDFGVARTKSDLKGRFSLAGVSGGGRPMIRAQARSFASETSAVVGTQSLKFRLSPGHDLRGVVTDRAERPVPKAALTLRASSSTLSARSLANGRFEVLGLKDLPYDLLVTVEGFAPFTRSGIPPDVLSLPVILDRASSVTGRLVDEEGKPLKGAVRLKSHDGVAIPGAFGRLASSQVGDDGKFAVASLRPGSNVIVLAGLGYPSFEKTIEIAQSGDTVALGDVPFEGGFALRARVVEKDDVPVPRARVIALPAPRAETVDPLFTEADAEGRFVMRGLKDQAYDIQVTGQGFAPLATKLSPAADEQVLVMKRALKLTGRIVDPEGVGVGRVQVSAQKADDRRSSRGTQSGADGRFTLELGEGGVMILTAAVESFERLSRSLQVEGDTELGDVALSRGLRLRGVVVDGRGGAVSGARVENQSTRLLPMTFAETDERGAFEMRGASAGRVRLVASHRDYTSAQVTVETPDGDGGDPDPVRITLTKGGRIEGVVLKRDGTPVAQARIELSRFGGPPTPRPSNAPQNSAVTGADGSFVFERLYPGPGRATLMSGQNGQYTSVIGAEVNVVEGETAQVSLVLRATVVRGAVRRRGQAAPGLRVSVYGDFISTSGGQDTTASLNGAIPWSVATTDALGRFALQISGPIKGRVSVTDGRGQSLYSKPVDIPDVAEFPLDVEFGAARAMGRVIDADTGLGIAEARITAAPVIKPGEAPVGLSQSGMTESSGEFALDMEPGEYRVSVSSPNYASASRNVTVSPPETSLGEIALDHGGTFLGRATLPSGRPVPDAQVRVLAMGTFASTMSGPDGSFTLKGLPTGSFFLTATDSSDHIAVLQLEALTPEVVEVRLLPAARMNVSLIGNPEPLSGITVAISRVDGELYTGGIAVRTDARGQALLLAPSGSLTLTARSSSHTGTAMARAQPGEAVNLTIEMKPNPVTPKR